MQYSAVAGRGGVGVGEAGAGMCSPATARVGLWQWIRESKGAGPQMEEREIMRGQGVGREAWREQEAGEERRREGAVRLVG